MYLQSIINAPNPLILTMSSKNKLFTQPWRFPMTNRDPNEIHRQASFLELFFDLCFVVAIAQVAVQFHHAIAEDHIVSGIIGFLTLFFAIWWAWMNFTWFASAYDNDDVPFRLAAFAQITGALILAAGVPQGFQQQDFDIIFAGYIVMRVGLVTLWLRAALNDLPRRTTAIKYAIGITVAMVGWAILLIIDWPLWGFWVMAAFELFIPVWAEKSAQTPWHPNHIAERYGLLTIIVLGESVLAATNAVQVALGEGGETSGLLLETIIGGLLILFSFWWLYFAKPAHHFLRSNKEVFVWGYGHYFIFASIAAVGAGLAVNIEQATHHTEITGITAAASVTIPAAVYLIMLWLIHIRPHEPGVKYSSFYLIGSLFILAATYSPWPILLTGLSAAILVIIFIIIAHSRHEEATA